MTTTRNKPGEAKIETVEDETVEEVAETPVDSQILSMQTSPEAFHPSTIARAIEAGWIVNPTSDENQLPQSEE